MKKIKATTEFQKKIFKKIDEALKEYIIKEDSRGATAFAFKMKEKVEFVFEALQRGNFKNKEERNAMIKTYQKQIEDYIPIIKEEVQEIINRENKIPDYIGFMITDERRFE